MNLSVSVRKCSQNVSLMYNIQTNKKKERKEREEWTQRCLYVQINAPFLHICCPQTSTSHVSAHDCYRNFYLVLLKKTYCWITGGFVHFGLSYLCRVSVFTSAISHITSSHFSTKNTHWKRLKDTKNVSKDQKFSLTNNFCISLEGTGQRMEQKTGW